MSAVLKIKEHKVRILEAAKNALSESNGDWHLAAKLLRKWADADKQLQLDLTYPLIDQACWDIVRKAGAVSRRGFFTAASGKGCDDTAGIAEASRQNWFEYPLPGGKKLGDANHSDLTDAADMHYKFAQSNKQRGEFFTLLAGRVGSKIVSDALTCADIDSVACSTMKVSGE